MRILLALALFLTLAACGRSDDEVGGFTNDWTGNEIRIDALADPKVEGITCHLTSFDRSFLDRIGKGNWFEDPSNASIACRQTGPIRIGDINLSKSGEEVFNQRQSLVFKKIAVRRVYDEAHDTLVYVVYSRQIVNGSAKMALSTVSLYGQNPVWEKGRPTAGN
jgi:CreA protein